MKIDRYFNLGLIVTAMIGAVFGYWFADMQVSAVSTEWHNMYPLAYFADTILKTTLSIVTCYLLSRLVLSYICSNHANDIVLAFSFTPLLMVYAHLPMLMICVSIVLLQVIYLVSNLRRADYTRLTKEYGIDVLVLLVYFSLHFFLTTRFSPLHWDKAILVAHGFSSEEIPVVVSLFKGFLLAKQYSFANVDHAQWAGIMHPPVGFTSTLLQLIAFIFDVPSLSYAAFHQLVVAIFFISMIAGSFGLYLFLRHGAKINAFFAFIGGYLFMFGGAPFLNQMFTSDGGYFLSSLIAFPYALLFIANAFSKNELRYALGAGIALASQFFILSPHPEGTIYCLFYYSVFTFGLFLFSTELTLPRRFYLAVASMLSFASLAAFSIAPVVIDKLMGNMFVYAHTGDIAYTYYRYFARYVHIMMLAGPLSYLLFYIYQKLTPVYLSSLLLGLSLIVTASIVSDQSRVEFMVHFLRLGLHVWCPPRTGVYVYTGAIIIGMYALNMIARFIYDLIEARNLMSHGAKEYIHDASI